MGMCTFQIETNILRAFEIAALTKGRLRVSHGIGTLQLKSFSPISAIPTMCVDCLILPISKLSSRVLYCHSI